MKIRIKTIQIVLLAILLVHTLLNSASAQGFYAGVSVGSTDFDGSQFGGSETGWGAHIGFDLGQYLGVELSYTDYQQFESRVPGQLLPSPVVVSLSGIVKYPILDRLEIFAKAGYANIDSDIDSSNPFYIGSRDESDAIYGAGFNLRISDYWMLRLGAERTELDLGTIPAGDFFTRSEGDLDVLHIGLIWKF